MSRHLSTNLPSYANLIKNTSRRTASRRSGALWGQTEALPIDQHNTAGPVAQDTVLVGDRAYAADTHEDSHPATHTPPAASAAAPAAGRSRNCSNTVAAAAAGEPKSNPSWQPEPGSNASSPRTPFQHQTAGYGTQNVKGGQEQSEGRASRRRGIRQRQKKPAVVREVKLAPMSNSGTVVAAALLLADGCVWWVPDLQVGAWEKVTVGDAAVIDRVSEGGFLSSAGVSAVAVGGLLLPPGQKNANKRDTIAYDCGGESVAGKRDSGGCGSGSEVAIVAGRDDGWLFLLSQSRPPPTTDADGREGDQSSSQPGAWRVSAAWKGHRSRVTAVWPVSDAARSRSPHAPPGGSQVFAAALETSRLSHVSGCKRRSDDRFEGALVSAGADGTVAWWGGACSEETQDMAHDGKSGSGSGAMTMPAPGLRMVRRIRDKLRASKRLTVCLVWFGCILMLETIGRGMFSYSFGRPCDDVVGNLFQVLGLASFRIDRI